MLAETATTSLDWNPLLAGWACGAAVTAALYGRQRKSRNANSVDVAWAFLLAWLCVLYGLLGPGETVPRILAAATGGLWGGRLSLHLFRDRVLREAAEDGRYQALRRHWGDQANRHFAWFYQAQAVLAVLLSMPFFLLSHSQATSVSPWQWIGVALALIGVIGESLADRQLARFRSDANNRGRTCRDGLWRYSRHPNYFFEWLTWVGFALVAVPAPYGEWALLAPVLMFVLLRWVTGVPYTEAQALRSRGDDYRAYQATTSVLIPWFPRAEREPRPASQPASHSAEGSARGEVS